jgi:glycoprotein-N-acetylgalactosamine 3-beta-galactosyltransferase
VNHDITDFPQGKHLTISEDSSLKLTDKYSYPQNLLLPQSIGNEDGVRRLFYTIKSIYEKVNPDFAFFVNDHTYVYADHLHSFLEQVLPDHTLYAGHALKNNNIIFNSGAAGYVLSRETIRQIVHRHEEKDPNCWLDEEKPNSEQKWLQGNPGLLLTTCLNSMGVRAIDTRDHHKHHKFHAFPITRLVKGNVDDWYINKHHFQELPLEERRGFDSSYFQLLNGPDCCSEHTISFHYVEYKESRALFSVRDALTNNPQMSNDELHKFMTSVWPSTRKEIGAYSRGLPPAEKQDEWSDLIDTIRKISIREDSGDCHIK